MADDDSPKSAKGSRFLKKSKWGKIFKEKDDVDSLKTVGQTGPTPSFKLNEDVVDFLKPSTEKSVPKIDIAIAKRWPDAADLRLLQDSNSPRPIHFTKPRRREGLVVAFVKTVPEVIGEGGDESEEPPREISKRKAVLGRSVSHGTPDSHNLGRFTASPPLPQARQFAPAQAPPSEDEFHPGVLRRTQTSNEYSPHLQRKHASPQIGATEPHKPSLGRTPTGLMHHHEQQYSSPVSPVEDPMVQLDNVMGGHGAAQAQAQHERPRSRDRPTVITSSQQHPTIQGERHFAALSAKDAASPVAQKRSEMSANEGLMFRRASMLVDHEDEDETSPPPSGHGLPSQAQPHLPWMGDSNQSSQGTTPTQSLHFSPLGSGSTPDTAVSPGLNPFDDPKFLKRHSKEIDAQHYQAQAQALHQPARTQAAQRAAVPQEHLQSSRHVPQISAPRPPPHQEYEQLNNVQYAQAPRSHEQNYPQGMRVPSDASRERSTERPALSLRSNGSNFSTLSPQSHHSRPTSREGSYSPKLSQASFTGSQQEQAARLQQHSQRQQSPMNQSPLSSLIASTQHPQQMASHLRREDAARSGSAASDYSSTPRPPKVMAPQVRQEDGNRPRASSGASSQYSGASSQHSMQVPRSVASLQQEDAGRFRADSASSNPSVTQHAKLAALHLRQEDAMRPGSPSSNLSRPSGHSRNRSTSPMPPELNDPAADAAYADFTARVAHMKGVFKLTAEKEQPTERCTPEMWLRAGLWWYLVGKAGLELLVMQRRPEDRRELLTQAHVDLAKAAWILSDPLEMYESAGEASPPRVGVSEEEAAESFLRRSCSLMRSFLKSLAMSMVKNNLFPPTQSLIQGQNTGIWLRYPEFSWDAAAVLGGDMRGSVMHDEPAAKHIDPFEVMPPSDTGRTFCYGRFPVDVYLNTDEADTDRVVLPCMLTILRDRREYQTSLTIASQNNLVNIRISPKQSEKQAITWSAVSWKASSCGIAIQLPRGFDLTVRMQERDFRAVWNLSEYARKIEKGLRPEPDEKLVHEARLAELQYADSSNAAGFPSDKLKRCTAFVFERSVPYTDGSGMRKMHRGYRLLLITEPGHKTMSSVSHELCGKSPLYFEYLTDSTANGQTAMVVRIREETRQCRALLVFADRESRQALYDVLNGLTIGPDETIVGRMDLDSLSIEPASPAAQNDGFSRSGEAALQKLQWAKLGVTNAMSDDPNSRIGKTVQSENLRIVARHATGCITDRVNLAKGELLFRLPVGEAPSIQLLREPQQDMTMSVDTRNAPSEVANGCGELLQTIMQQPTIRTFTFSKPADLHTFQAGITGFTVRYDGTASTFGISRRRMVVPIYKKWETSNVRVQIVEKGNVVQFLAFMEDFSHADALCFQIKSMDTFETVPGDSKKGKKWGIKLVDAKFKLPGEEEDKVKRRFVNLEGLEYAEEHDDITVGFETERDRDLFAQALPGATSVSRGITLKRRI